ncbi:hypothetical protein XBKB1_530031 [Xenorhabdus bovienii str. kraussei Becker Underwood]|uniref:Uncharacterized protein n=1 Tax=Xenorhabdus bovienii str. kraussei Becker Underwood TaxID=1398204 RepID=A0A077Q2N0_XENBV|nr:hypothetical protein XBKB1_530031 [Xenorhabdus bovienii str. kraussei Becker Underwood]
MIGTEGTTAIDSYIAAPEVKARIGHNNLLGRQATSLIPNARLYSKTICYFDEREITI